jgi:hypothetical protein
MSDGGEDVRQVQEYLHPNGEHIIDWFHITMRVTVLQQQTKALQAERPEVGASSSKQIESIKHLLWHCNVDEALNRIESLFMDLDLISKLSAPADKLATGIGEFRTTFGITGDRSPTSGSGTGREKRSARRLWNRRSTK